MSVDVRQAISLISQRIVLAPAQVEVPSPFGRGTVEKRFREGLITEAQFRQEMQSLGYIGATIDRSLVLAKLEHQFDNFSDKLDALGVAYDKDIITYAEIKVQLLELISDQEKALLILELLDYKKRPAPKAVTPEKTPTLTVSQLLAAFVAGTLTEPLLRSELAERGYSEEDIVLLVSTEAARLAKPTTTQRKLLTLAQLNAMLAAGILTIDEFVAELLARNYSEEDAARLLGLEMIKINARAA